MYTPIRAYALRNIWYYKEELQHEGGDEASDVTEEEDKAIATNKQRSNQIAADTQNQQDIQVMSINAEEAGGEQSQAPE